MERSIERPDSLVERMYDQAMDRLGPLGRLERGFRMYAEARQMLSYWIQQASPGLSERELRRQVAMRFYLTDDRTQDMLRKM